jgi:hypothetical protein
MRKFIIKVLLITLALGWLFIWLRSDASVLAGSSALGMDDAESYLAAAAQNPAPFDLLEAANTDMVRVALPFNEVTQAPGTYSWEYQSDSGYVDYSLLFDRLTRRGIKPIVVLSGGPAFANHLYPQQPVFRGDLLDLWEGFVRAAVQEFGDKVHYWQIGSVINDPAEWGRVLFPGAQAPNAPPDPELYSEILQIAYSVIKSDSAGDTVLLGGLALDVDCAFHPTAYLQALANQDALYAIDVINIELPILNGAPETASVESCGYASIQTSGIPSADALAAIRDIVKESGKKPIWVHGLSFTSETLASAALERGTMPEVVESDYLARASGLLLAYGSMERVFWRFDPTAGQPSALALQSYANLTRSLAGSPKDSRFTGDNLQVLRFRGNGGLSVLTWRQSGGDAVQPAIIQDVADFKLRAYSTDAESLKTKYGLPLSIDAGGDTALMVGERPVLIRGRPDGAQQMLATFVQDNAAQAGKGLQAKFTSWLGAQKAKAADKVGAWVDEQQKSLMDMLRDSFNLWLRKNLGLAKG